MEYRKLTKLITDIVQRQDVSFIGASSPRLSWIKDD